MTEGRPAAATRTAAPSLFLLGLVTMAIAAWGGIVAYVGPEFGYSADGSTSWQWSMTHSVLALVPGAIGVLAGLLFLVLSRPTRHGANHFLLMIGGLAAMACGAWFVIGPAAWPVVYDIPGYFVAAPPFRALVNAIGYSLGTGVILASCGAFALGWSVRRQRLTTASPQALTLVDEGQTIAGP